MKNWEYSENHKNFVTWAFENNSPILTTNFENTLGQAGSCSLYRFSKKAKYVYPWESYYSHEEIANPSESFAIWHINGMQRYHRSICLGLNSLHEVS